jgi:hypothetical protein
MSPLGMYRDGDGRPRPLTRPADERTGLPAASTPRRAGRARRVGRVVLTKPPALLWMYPLWTATFWVLAERSDLVWPPVMAAVSGAAWAAALVMFAVTWARASTGGQAARARFARLSRALEVFVDAALLIVLGFFWLVAPERSAPRFLAVMAVIVAGGLLVDVRVWWRLRR